MNHKSLLLSIFILTYNLPVFCQNNDNDNLIFSITGDGPYAETDWDLIPQYIGMEKTDGKSEFIIHVGDLNSGGMDPDEEYYVRVADLYKTSPIPMIFILGDNEWNDHADPVMAWEIWKRYFKYFPDHFNNSPKLERQPEREENLAWISKHVLFVGLNMVGGKVVDPEEWKQRHQHNADWVKSNFNRYQSQVHCAIVFAHANPNAKHEDFFSQFIPEVEKFKKPVMYIHGDGHNWQHEPEWKTKNLLRVQVDQISKASFLQVTVTHDPVNPFEFNRRK